MEAGRLRMRVLSAVVAAFALATPSALAAGDGTFTASPDGSIAVGATPNRMVVADFNQDGDPDLAVTNRDSNDLSLLSGTTGASFTPTSDNVPLTGSPGGIVSGDFNQDGDPDLAVVTSNANAVTVLTGGGGSTFTVGTPISTSQVPTAITISDFNQDGDPDLAVTRSNGFLTVLVGGANSSFTIPAGAPGSGRSAGDSPSAIASADLNGDGDPDLAATSQLSNNVTILLGTAGGADFATQPTQPATGVSPRAIVAANFDGDAAADPDLAIANSTSDSVTLLTGTTAAAFTPASPLTAGDEPSAIAASDLNGDGDPDLAVANEASAAAAGSVSIFLGGSGVAFSAAPGSPLTTAARPLAIASGDLNGDTSADLVVASGATDVLEVFLGKAPATQPPPGGGDKTPPQTTIDAGPTGKTDKAKAKIRYSANEAATFECKLKGKGVDKDLRAFEPCGAAKVKYKGLDSGKKKFQVRAIDAAGNVDPSPAKLKWKVLG